MKKNYSRPASAGAVTKDDWLDLNGSDGNSEVRSNKESEFDAQNVAHDDLPEVEGAEPKAAEGPSLEELLPAYPKQNFVDFPLIYNVADKYGHGDPYSETMLEVATLATLSALLSNVYFVREGKKFYPNLGVIVAAPPASGKGNIDVCRELINGIDKKLHESFLHEREAWNGSSANAPKMSSLVFPEDCTSAAFKQMMCDNQGCGLMQTTEIKSLINMLNTPEYGLSRVNLLKSLWNEEISFARKGDVQNIKIPESKLAIVSSGVPADILSFLGTDGVGSGLLSRMVFFALVTQKRVWRKWSVADDEPAHEMLQEERTKSELIYESLQRRQEPLRVRFTQEQFDRINELYQPRFEEGEEAKSVGIYWDSVIKRTPVIVCRIAMILSVLATDAISLEMDKSLTCPDKAFGTAFELCEVLTEHSRYFYFLAVKENAMSKEKEAFSRLAKSVGQSDISKRKKLTMLLKASERFTRKEFYELARAAGYISQTSMRRVFAALKAAEELQATGEVRGGDVLYMLSINPPFTCFLAVASNKKRNKNGNFISFINSNLRDWIGKIAIKL